MKCPNCTQDVKLSGNEYFAHIDKNDYVCRYCGVIFQIVGNLNLVDEGRKVQTIGQLLQRALEKDENCKQNEKKFYAVVESIGEDANFKIGDEFLILEFDEIDDSKCERGFYISLEPTPTRSLFCLERHCSHLGGGNWKIEER